MSSFLRHFIQPVLVDFHLDQIVRGTAIIVPHVLLRKAHAIEHFSRLAIEAIGKLLGIWISAANALDHALFAAYVIRRAPMAGRGGTLDHHAVANLEAMTWRCGIGRRTAAARL